MNPLPSHTLRALVVLAAFAAANVCAQDLYWDTSSATAGLQGGNGTWNTSSFWNPATNGSGTPQGWTSGAKANFSGASSTVDLEGATWNVGRLAWTGGITVTLTNGGGVNLGGGITNNNSGSASTLNGPISLTAPQTFALQGGGIGNIQGSLNIGTNALAINATGNNRVNISATLTGSANITISTDNAVGTAANANRLVQFTGNTTNFTGSYILSKGVLGVYNISGYSANSALQFANTADAKEFNIFAANVTLGGLNSNGGAGAEFVSLGNHSARPLTLDTSVTGGGFDFGGTIRQLDATKALSLVKAGAGTQTLSGTNTYTGTTTVQGGTLIVNGVHSTGSAYTVSSNATLAGKGTIGSAITVNSGATLAAGGADGQGTLTVTNLSLAAGATNRVVLAGPGAGQQSRIHLPSGSINMTNANLTVEDSAMTGSGEFVIIQLDAGATRNGTFSGLPQGASVTGTSGLWTISYVGGDGNDVTLSRPALQVETRPPTAATDTTADLVGAVTYVDPGGAEMWIYYGTVDGGDVAENWQSSVRVGGGLTAGEHSVHVQNLDADSRYYYRVYAVHGELGVWADASQVFGTRFTEGQSPANFTAQDGWDQVTLSWDEAFQSETGFVIQRATDNNFTANVTTWQVTGINTATTVDATADPGVTYYYRVAAVNSAGQSEWSDVVTAVANPSQETIANLTLTQSTVFALQEETRKMALRGTREATEKATIAGITVPLATDNPFKADNYGAPTDSSWYADPYNATGTTEFRESYAWRFDFGNGVVRDLDLVPLKLSYSPYSENHILLNLAFTGALNIDGTNYIVEVVQGVSPLGKSRLNYPGYFDDPEVAVLLYNASTGERVESTARLKQIDGTWYSFESNPSGEQLVVKRINAAGTMVLNAGAFQQPDLGFVSGSFSGPNGWQIDMSKVDFTNGQAVLPAGTYTFPEFTIRNNGVDYTIIYHSHGSGSALGVYEGSFTVPVDASATFYVGRSATVHIEESSNYAKDVHGYSDAEALDIFMFDDDQKGAIIPNGSINPNEAQTTATGPRAGEKNVGRIASYTNSEGGSIQVTKWNPKMCGWNGNWIWNAETKDASSTFILGVDSNPPAVFDTRTITYHCELPALYGQATGSKTINVRNEGYSLHARYYDFDGELTGYPDFNELLPDLEIRNARMAYTATDSPWTDVAAFPAMSDTFAVRYDFEIDCRGFRKSDGTFINGDYTFYLRTQGYARLYIDDQLVMEKASPNEVTEVTSAAYPFIHGTRLKARLEYFHNTGKSALSLVAAMYAPPYGSNLSFNPDDPRSVNYFRAMNKSVVAPSQQVTSPVDLAATGEVLGVTVASTHPDGAPTVECFVDGVKVAADTAAPYTFNLSGLPVGARVDLRYTDPFGFGHLSPVATVRRESLAEWLTRHGLSSGSGTEDADGDGKTNAEEYKADTNPNDAQSGLKTAGSSFVPESSAMRINWDGVTTGSPAISHYQIQSSPDLVTWTNVGAPVPLNATGRYSADCEMGSETKCFFRIISVPR